jgi:hypothetical protein
MKSMKRGTVSGWLKAADCYEHKYNRLSFHPFVRPVPSFHPDLRCTQFRRAQRPSRMARLRATALAARSVLDGREHDGTLGRVCAANFGSNRIAWSLVIAGAKFRLLKNGPAEQRGQVERKYDTHTNNVH